ncbi:MAG: aldo/keto reductase, partial [Bacteroidota bacterium]
VQKIALGTVQFGLPYGITNVEKRIPNQETVARILSYALEQGITYLDTAKLYGNSEEVLGKVGTKGFEVVTKLPSCSSDQVEKEVEDSCKKLGVESLYGYLLHSFQSFVEDPLPYQKLIALQSSERIRKIGFSLYYPSELEYLLEEDIEFGLVQVPYSLLDRRFEPYFERLTAKGVEIHTRSAFLQGVFFLSPPSLPIHLQPIHQQVREIQALSKKWEVSIAGICLGFVLKNPFLSKGVIGVDSLEQMKANVLSLETIPDHPAFWPSFNGLEVSDEKIVVPSNWKVD